MCLYRYANKHICIGVVCIVLRLWFKVIGCVCARNQCKESHWTQGQEAFFFFAGGKIDMCRARGLFFYGVTRPGFTGVKNGCKESHWARGHRAIFFGGETKLICRWEVQRSFF